MAATGTEYVTLEQLKDLVTNMIQPLVDAVGNMRKIVPVTCANYDQTYVNLKLADGYSSSSVSMSSGDMMLIVNSEDGTYENGSYLLYTGPGKELTNSNVTWQRVQLTEYKTAASTVKMPDGVAMFSKIENSPENPLDLDNYQLMIKTNGETSPVASFCISDEIIDSVENNIDKSMVVVSAAKSSETMPAGAALIGVQAANANGEITNAVLNIYKPDEEPSSSTFNIVAVRTDGNRENFTAEDLSNATKSMICGTDKYTLVV